MHICIDKNVVRQLSAARIHKLDIHMLKNRNVYMKISSVKKTKSFKIYYDIMQNKIVDHLWVYSREVSPGNLSKFDTGGHKHKIFSLNSQLYKYYLPEKIYYITEPTGYTFCIFICEKRWLTTIILQIRKMTSS